MTAKQAGNAADDAMLTWLAGDEAVTAAADRIWNATGNLADATAALHTAQTELEAATDAYSHAIRACRIPPQHAERLGAAVRRR